MAWLPLKLAAPPRLKAINQVSDKAIQINRSALRSWGLMIKYMSVQSKYSHPFALICYYLALIAKNISYALTALSQLCRIAALLSQQMISVSK